MQQFRCIEIKKRGRKSRVAVLAERKWKGWSSASRRAAPRRLEGSSIFAYRDLDKLQAGRYQFGWREN